MEMILNVLFGALVIAFALAMAFGLVYIAEELALATLDFFEEDVIPFFRKVFSVRQ